MENELSHSMVHYLLTIHKLKDQKGYARVTDIAKDLKLTKGSVSTAINNLKKKELVQEEEDSKFLLLTEIGHQTVHKVLSSRTLLFHFLQDILGVESDTAANDACLMEHLMSSETRTKLFNYMKGHTNICNCDDGVKINKKILGLNLSDYEDASSFEERQDASLSLNKK